MSQNSSGECSVSGILFLIFLVLKLTGNITWSWWWVTSPLWIGIGLNLVFLLIIYLLYNDNPYYRRFPK